jgi:tRNA-Thr(GGU) m(6)t(6)A37 methyltransferase TsaA
MDDYTLHPIGVINSNLKSIYDCPLQGDEGAPEAVVNISPLFETAIDGLKPGDQVIIITWLHKGNRQVLKCRRRNETDTDPVGVFSTRSPDRPNPIGLHTVKIMEINKSSIKVFPLEALHGTPVVDIKPVI